jgi:hypothetical protein
LTAFGERRCSWIMPVDAAVSVRIEAGGAKRTAAAVAS